MAPRLRLGCDAEGGGLVASESAVALPPPPAAPLPRAQAAWARPLLDALRGALLDPDVAVAESATVALVALARGDGDSAGARAVLASLQQLIPGGRRDGDGDATMRDGGGGDGGGRDDADSDAADAPAPPRDTTRRLRVAAAVARVAALSDGAFEAARGGGALAAPLSLLGAAEEDALLALNAIELLVAHLGATAAGLAHLFEVRDDVSYQDLTA